VYIARVNSETFFEIKKLVEIHNGQFIIFKDERPEELLDIETGKAFF